MLRGQFLRFLGVGGTATALMYLLLIVQVDGLGWPATPSSALAYGLSAGFNYWANYHWTFASRQAHGTAVQRFIAVAAAGLGLNTAIMYLLVNFLGWHYLFSQLLATAVVLLWNFLANRRWTFQAHHRTGS